MKTKSKLALVLGAAVIILTSFSSCGYNTMVAEREAVVSQWANVETQYQRRADLVPNLVATVQGYAKHEKEVFAAVSQARSDLANAIKIDGSITDNPEKLAAFQEAQTKLSSSLSRLLAIAEAYPELKANQNFLDLQSQLEGTENRIATERRRYNEVVQKYNSTIQQFPGMITAKLFHFAPKSYYKADETAQTAPTVSFD